MAKIAFTLRQRTASTSPRISSTFPRATASPMRKEEAEVKNSGESPSTRHASLGIADSATWEGSEADEEVQVNSATTQTLDPLRSSSTRNPGTTSQPTLLVTNPASQLVAARLISIEKFEQEQVKLYVQGISSLGTGSEPINAFQSQTSEGNNEEENDRSEQGGSGVAEEGDSGEQGLSIGGHEEEGGGQCLSEKDEKYEGVKRCGQSSSETAKSITATPSATGTKDATYKDCGSKGDKQVTAREANKAIISHAENIKLDKLNTGNPAHLQAIRTSVIVKNVFAKCQNREGEQDGDARAAKLEQSLGKQFKAEAVTEVGKGKADRQKGECDLVQSQEPTPNCSRDREKEDIVGSEKDHKSSKLKSECIGITEMTLCQTKQGGH